MPPKNVIFGLAIIVVVIIVGGASWAQFNKTDQTTPTPSPSPSSTATFVTPDQIRDQSMVYISTINPATGSLMTNLSWTGGRLDTELAGAETCLYYSNFWNVTIQYPVIPNPNYTVTANYSSGVVSVFWQGTYHSGMFVNTSYKAEGLWEPESIVDAVMNFMKGNHNETAQYIQNVPWSGGRIDTGLLGVENYEYQSINGWSVSMHYPVVLNPLYTINATYVSPISEIFPPQKIIEWQGTWQNGNTTETNYQFKP
jgi:hypothetical protein